MVAQKLRDNYFIRTDSEILTFKFAAFSQIIFFNFEVTAVKVIICAFFLVGSSWFCSWKSSIVNKTLVSEQLILFQKLSSNVIWEVRKRQRKTSFGWFLILKLWDFSDIIFRKRFIINLYYADTKFFASFEICYTFAFFPIQKSWFAKEFVRIVR